MALLTNLATLKTELSAEIKSNIETAYDLGSNPEYVPSELQKYSDAIANAVADKVINFLIDFTELNGAALDSPSVTVDTETGLGAVDDGSVSGGIS